MKEAKLDHGIDRPVDTRRRDDQMPGLIPAERGTDGEIAIGHIADEEGPPLGRRLSQQALALPHIFGNSAVFRDAIHRQLSITDAILDEYSTGMSIQITGQEAENIVAE